MPNFILGAPITMELAFLLPSVPIKVANPKGLVLQGE